MPEILSSLRSIIDRGRRVGCYLMLGSASFDLLRQSGQPLGSRVEFISLAPLSVLELDDSRKVRELLWLRRGFPDRYLAKDNNDSNLAKDNNDSNVWRRNFIKSYLERDVATFGFQVSAELLERL